RPAQQRRTLHQGVLPVGRFAGFQSLQRCGLADIHDGLTLPTSIANRRGRQTGPQVSTGAGSLRVRVRRRSRSVPFVLNGAHEFPPAALRTGHNGPPTCSALGRVADVDRSSTAPGAASEAVAAVPLGGYTGAVVVGHESPPCGEDRRCWHQRANPSHTITL